MKEDRIKNIPRAVRGLQITIRTFTRGIARPGQMTTQEYWYLLEQRDNAKVCLERILNHLDEHMERWARANFPEYGNQTKGDQA